VVIHFTAMTSAAEARARLCDPAAEVSAHWLIDRDGVAEQLVDEGLRAWHAGAGSWGGAGDVNSRSIGIELQNTGDEPFAAPQMAALERLLRGIMLRWAIRPEGVIGHSDMAPDRKADPGPRFDWRRLALQGLSVWPEAKAAPPPPSSPMQAKEGSPVDRVGFAADLRRFGYPDLPLDLLLRAFRQRFRPWGTGPLDALDCALAADLAARFPVDALPATA
jgi:N-acetylmuramoyl-L-alanine amidase